MVGLPVARAATFEGVAKRLTNSSTFEGTASLEITEYDLQSSAALQLFELVVIPNLTPILIAAPHVALGKLGRHAARLPMGLTIQVSQAARTRYASNMDGDTASVGASSIPGASCGEGTALT